MMKLAKGYKLRSQVILILILGFLETVYAQNVVKFWTRQLGTSGRDCAFGVATDGSGNIYVTGYTEGGLDGNTNAGGRDIFLVKYDINGNKQWTRQLGISIADHGLDDDGRGVATDGSGNIYVTGATYYWLDWDIFLVKYDSNGNKQWTRLLGSGTGDYDCGYGVATDGSGNIYVTGYTEGGLDGNTNAGGSDIFLVKYDTNGNKQWTRQLGTNSSDCGRGVATDGSGNIYVTGYTDGGLDGNTNAGSSDIFLIKYDTNGNKQWTRQLGTSIIDHGFDVATDGSGNIYVTGDTNGGLDGNTNAGGLAEDIFLVKYDTNGNKQWTRQLGTGGYNPSDVGFGVATDGSGNIYVTGYTWGGLDGNTNAGRDDIFLVKYDTNGNKQWTRQLGTNSSDCGRGVATDGSGNIYVTGDTDGGLDGNTNAGGRDIFLVKYGPNTIPTLSWTGEANYESDGLNPESGDSSTSFTYQVNYTDINNDPPLSGYPRLHIKKGGTEIDGSPFLMQEVDSGDTNYTDGKLYAFTKTGLSDDTTTFAYFFEAKDIFYANATGNATNLTDGPVTRPFAPAEFSIVPSTGSIQYLWTDESHVEAGYYVCTSTYGRISPDLGTDASSWTESGLTPNTRYSRCIEVYNPAGSAYSDVISSYTLANPPTGLSVVTVAANAVELSWDANSNPSWTHYGIACSTDNFTANVSTSVVFADKLMDTRGFVFDLAPRTSYWFRVWAYNEDKAKTSYDGPIIIRTLLTGNWNPPGEKYTEEIDTAEGIKIKMEVPDTAFSVPTKKMEINLVGTEHAKFDLVRAADQAAKNKGVTQAYEIIVTDYLNNILSPDEFHDKIRLTFTYPSDLSLTQENQLRIFRLNETARCWEEQDDCKVNAVANTISLDLDHLSIYKVISKVTGGFEELIVYPNPFKVREAKDGLVKFINLPDKVTLQIYSIAGELVYDKEYVDTKGGITWNGKNNSGRRVATGIYVYLLKDDNGHKKKGKLSVIW